VIAEDCSTDRLRLTRISADDLPDVLRLHTDPAVMATLGGVRTREPVEAGVATLARHWDEHGFGPWIGRTIETSEFVGLGGLRLVTIEETAEVEVGYALIPAFWGQGLATELARMAVQVGFDVVGLPALVSFSLPTNLPSRRVMEKAGFRYERDFVHKRFPQVLYRHHRGQLG
jgi:ribosomal-protein-alanine N-acetyltransferase